MKLVLSWLKELVEINLPPEKLAERLSVSLTEVEKIEKVGSETVIEIENKALTHRPDCFALEGIAREISAITGSRLKEKKKEFSLPKSSKSHPLKIKVEDQRLCPRYTGVVITDLKIRPSPDWIQKRLELSGIRPINNIVDVTNYVMLQTGQALHAFDYQKVKNQTIVVRKAKRGEGMTTLDGVERKLDPEMLLICDPEKPIALAGVMGGANTEVSSKTKTLILESANFERFNNRRTTAHLGLRTEASTRFEKGQDPEKTFRALKLAASMLAEYANGKVGSKIEDVYPNPQKEKVVPLKLKSIEQKLGLKITAKQIEKILLSLELKVKKGQEKWQITAPTFRKDLQIEADLLEEIARIYGYDKFKPTLPPRDLKPVSPNPEVEFEKKTKEILEKLGFDEIYSYTFVGEKLWSDCLLDSNKLIKIKNPLSPELAFLRNSLLPSLIEKVAFNANHYDQFALFEIAKEIHSQGKNLPLEPKKIVGGLFSTKGDTFPDLKGKVESLFIELGLKPEFRNQLTGRFLPFEQKQSAEIYLRNKMVGRIGKVDPQVKTNFSIKGSLSLFELDFETLIKSVPDKKPYHSLPKYPHLTFDLSFIIDQKILAQEIINAIEGLKISTLKSVEIMDVFTNPKFGSDKKSVTLHFLFGSSQKTLTDKEIKPETQKIMRALEKNLNAEIRKE